MRGGGDAATRRDDEGSRPRVAHDGGLVEVGRDGLHLLVVARLRLHARLRLAHVEQLRERPLDGQLALEALVVLDEVDLPQRRERRPWVVKGPSPMDGESASARGWSVRSESRTSSSDSSAFSMRIPNSSSSMPSPSSTLGSALGRPSASRCFLSWGISTSRLMKSMCIAESMRRVVVHTRSSTTIPSFLGICSKMNAVCSVQLLTMDVSSHVSRHRSK